MFDQLFMWLESPIFERLLCRFLHCGCDDELRLLFLGAGRCRRDFLWARSRVARRGCPRPAPEEPCMGLSIHTAQASPKASWDTRLHNCVGGVRTISTAIEMVHREIACCIRPALRFLHDMASTPTSVLRDWFVAGGTQAVLPSPDTVKLGTTSRRV